MVQELRTTCPTGQSPSKIWLASIYYHYLKFMTNINKNQEQPHENLDFCFLSKIQQLCNPRFLSRLGLGQGRRVRNPLPGGICPGGLVSGSTPSSPGGSTRTGRKPSFTGHLPVAATKYINSFNSRDNPGRKVLFLFY